MTNKENNKIISKRILIVYVLFFYLAGLFLSSWYRPYIYSNAINDYGLADIGNNIPFIPAVYFSMLLLRQKFFYGAIKDIYYYAGFLIVIEILSGLIDGIGTFDFKDIIGLLIGAGITYGLMKNSHRN